MAFNIRKIDPLDLQPRTGVGIQLPFNTKNVFTTTYTTKDALKANLINFFLTGKNERIFRPNFGAGVRSFLFENITQEKLEILREKVVEEIRVNFSNITITNLELEFNQNSNNLNIIFNYFINDTNIEDEILINIQG